MVFLRGVEDTSKSKWLILENSIIMGMPQIARSKGKVRAWKIFVFCSCTLGFFYQILQFSLIFWTYPTILTIDIRYPDYVKIPAFTYCMTEWFDKYKYCDKYPENCETGPNERLTIKKEALHFLRYQATKEYFDDFGVDIESAFFYEQTTWNQGNYINEKYFSMPMVTDDGERAHCYILNHQLWKLEENETMMPAKPQMMYYAYLNTEQIGLLHNSSIILDKSRTRRYISLHSPHQLSNPYYEGKRFEVGRIFIVHTSVKERQLLPAPYKTDCYDYQKEWQKKGSGPLSKQSCINTCIFQMTSQACGCVPAHLLHRNNVKFCMEKDANCLDQLDVNSCHVNCKEACRETLFEFHESIRDFELTMDLLTDFIELSLAKPPRYDFSVLDYSKESFILIGITLGSVEKLSYVYKPKYETIEMFSFIGGYIGVWLGISLAAVMDFFKIAVILLKRRDKKK